MSTKPSAVFLKSVTRLEDLPEDDKPQIAFVGRSNVGKSTLINSLTGVKGLARTSSSPGLTKALNFFEVNRTHYFVDLPGYGYASKSKAQREYFLSLITDYLQRASGLRLVLVVVDARIGLTDLDEKMVEFLRKAGLAYALVVNKADKLAKGRALTLLRTLVARFPDVKCVLHSASAGTGRGEIIAAIERALKAGPAAA